MLESQSACYAYTWHGKGYITVIPWTDTVPLHIQDGPKIKPLLIYRQIVLKPADEVTFSLKLNVEQATGVNANKNLLVLNILSIKYSIYDVKCDVNYCAYTLRCE